MEQSLAPLSRRGQKKDALDCIGKWSRGWISLLQPSYTLFLSFLLDFRDGPGFQGDFL